MFTLQKDHAHQNRDEWKIKNIKRVSDLKRSYDVVTGRRAFSTVTLCNTPSCNCRYFSKHKGNVCCKHIIFVVAVALKNDFLEAQLRKRCLGDEDVKVLLAETVATGFLLCKGKSASTKTIEGYKSHTRK